MRLKRKSDACVRDIGVSAGQLRKSCNDAVARGSEFYPTIFTHCQSVFAVFQTGQLSKLPVRSVYRLGRGGGVTFTVGLGQTATSFLLRP